MRKQMRTSVLSVLTLATLVRFCPGEESARCAQVSCLASCLPLPMMKDMINTLKSTSKPWPSDSRRHKRYLPKFYVKKLNIADINKMLGIYEDHIFKNLWSHDIEYPERFIHSFYRLRVNVKHCKDRSQAELTRYARKKIKGMEEAFKKLQLEELSKAAGDFETILRWISLYTDKKLSHSKCQ
ncbi:interleukin-26 isoform X2 [Neoarius graeffei]|uniref:interleukin-26 isoform X2 n=1 Tax=Neoarius graeffei TaxID=443677 RepID=UPI00298D5CD8|nr:interleukin-26 isoform X2 [Neoarius graeffei]